jgi:hypothetical protein
MKIVLPGAIALMAFCQLTSPAQTTLRASGDPGQNHRQPSPRPIADRSLAANYSRLPLSFEANQGQSDPQVRFLSRGAGYSLFLTDKAAVLALAKPNTLRRQSAVMAKGVQPARSSSEPITPETSVVRMELAGALEGLRVDGAEPLPGKTNYFIGKDPAKWRSNVPTYAKVKYSGVYPGVDLVYYGNQRQLEYDFVVAPGADARPVRLHFAGASRLKLNSDGDLTVAARHGQIAFHKPVVYQERDGRQETIEGQFILLARNTVAFRLGNYDHSRELVIDPVLAYSTYLGGSGVTYNDGGDGSPRGDGIGIITVDSAGNAYVAGNANSTNFPVTRGAFQQTNPITQPGVYTSFESFVTKMNASGTALIYSTYFGGLTNDPNYIETGGIGGIAVDGTGAAYLSGTANSLDFPTTPGAFDRVASNYGKAYVAKLDPTGSTLIYSTLLGGSQGSGENGGGIAVDSVGNAYVDGTTYSADFPTTAGAFQRAFKGNGDFSATGYVTKVNATGSGLIYSTLLGGSMSDGASSISLDKSGAVYVSGYASSADFPITPGAYDKVFSPPSGSMYSGFVTKLNADGSGLIYSTYFPIGSIAVDAAGNVYEAGRTGPVGKGAIATKGSGWVGKLNATGTALVYGTYLGGTDIGVPGGLDGIAVDPQGHAYVAGYSYGGFPVTPDAFQPTFPGTTDPDEGQATYSGVMAELNSDGSALLYATYLGGSGGFVPGASPYSVGDNAGAIALDSAGNVYVGGTTSSSDFPVTQSAFQTFNRAVIAGNGFITKFAFHGATTTTLTSNGDTREVGANVIFTAHVAPVSGTGTPTGTVNFLVDGITELKTPLDKTGQAVYETKGLPVGPHAVVASYYGHLPDYSSSSDGPLTETITGQLAAPVFFPLGGTYRVTQQVTLTSPYFNAVIRYTTDGSAPTTGSAVYQGPIPVAANETIRAMTVADGDGFTTSPISTAVYKIVPTAIPTATSLISSANPSVLGQDVTFTATVTAKSGPTPTGTVSFRNGAEIMGVVPLTNGVANFTTSGLTLFGHNITAVYTGSATNAEKGSPVLVQEVTP